MISLLRILEIQLIFNISQRGSEDVDEEEVILVHNELKVNLYKKTFSRYRN